MKNTNKTREKFSSRLGFILISAGCAIGLGNVYRFPIITGAYGGAIFVLIYIAFLILLGVPVMVAELSVGRGSQRSIATSFDVLEKDGQKWHFMKYLGIGGNYLLMMCYTIITGYMMIYFVKYLNGSILDISSPIEMREEFFTMMGDPVKTLIATYIAVFIGLLVCSLGLKNGVERITKVIMIALFVLMIGLAVYALTLPGAKRGLSFYLVPNVENISKAGLSKVIIAAMGQAFFTLSLGIGSIGVFGSYISKDRSLLGESLTIVGLDTAVALIAGLIIFPAYFSYNSTMIEGEGGAAFLFTTLTSIFNNMRMGIVFGTLFFLFMIFAAMSTVIAVFENIMSFWIEKTDLSRFQIMLINLGLMFVLTLPAIFANNILADVKILGMTLDSIEDFMVSNLALPIGSLVYVLFCTTKFGWGWKNFYAEVNTGNGLKLPKWLKPYMTFVLPIIIITILVIQLVASF